MLLKPKIIIDNVIEAFDFKMHVKIIEHCNFYVVDFMK